VYLLGPGERLELTHRASSRDVFAHGALRAARFVIGKKPGRYTIADVLG
jgi:4-hydroxy-tetrahydrodipicolinate reductase